MEFKGTKGKWIIQFGGLFLSIKGSKKSEMQANALLISKAPEMLEMLNKLYANDLLKDNADEVLQLIKEATELN